MKIEWPIKRLGEVCEIIMGQSPDGKSYNTTGEGVPLINGPVEFSAESFGKTLRAKFTTQPTKFAKEGDLILCVRGSTTGRMNIAGFDACIGRGVAAIRAIQYQPWINYFISSKRDQIHGKGTGATFPNVSGNSLANFELVFPPIPEQQRIVALLDEAFEGLATAKANVERNLQNARAIYASHLQAVFSQPGEGWTEKEIKEICTLINGRAYKKDEMLGVGKYPLLRVGNFFSNRDWYYSNLELDASKYCDKGDLLYAWSASFGPQIWEGEKVIYHYHIWKVLPKELVVDKRFLLYLLEWDVDQIKLAHGTGATMMHVSKGSMESRLVPIPSLHLQSDIVSQLDGLRVETQYLTRLYERKLSALEELKTSLLQQAFSGEL
jgi:type I restriction enzyme S subunit